MPLFIVRVAIAKTDDYGVESSSVADTYVPVEATDDSEACRLAVLWHGDNSAAIEGDDLLWVVIDSGRNMQFKATKSVLVNSEEMDTFLSLTQGIAAPIIIGKSKR